MNKYYYVSHFAAAYGEGTYGACSYNEGGTTASCSTSGGGSSSGAGGTAGTDGSSSGLANTGVMIAGIITLACVIIFAALVVRMIRRSSSRRKLATQEVSVRPSTTDRE